MITIKSSGNFMNTKRFLNKARESDIYSILEKYAYEGIIALQDATPKRTGLTSRSWSFEIRKQSTGYSIFWNNENIQKGVNIALIIQLGHATGRGVYVTGIDYINPALEPVFKRMADGAWNEVMGNARSNG